MSTIINDLKNYGDYNSFENSLKDNSNFTIKSDENVSLVYFNDSTSGVEKSIIFDKNEKKPIVTQFNKILYNKDAENFLIDKDWKQVVVEKCYEGTVLTVFYNKDRWYVSTRRCLDANDSYWVKNVSYKEMFEEAIQDRFTYDDLDKDNCYFFVLLHYKNRNLINYSNLGYEVMYKDIIHIMTTKKYTSEEVDFTINDKVKKSSTIHFSNLSELLDDLDYVSKDNRAKKTITTEGYILRYYHGEVKKSDFTVLKLQTKLYQELIKVKPNNSNLHMIYLELYQKDRLTEFLPYFSKYNTDIIRRINNSMRTVAQELLDIYHGTRQQNNPEVYKSLKEHYKKSLYDLHGIFIRYRKPKFDEDKEKTIGNRSITVHDVYHYLKDKQPAQLRNIYQERMQMVDMPCFDKFLNKECLDTVTLTMLMFQSSVKSD